MSSLKLSLIILSFVLPGVILAEQMANDQIQYLAPRSDEGQISSELLSGGLVLLDQIECVVCGPESNTPIVDTYLTWKRDLNGKFESMQKQIQNEIVRQQVVSEKMPLDESASDKYINGMKTQNNLSEADLVEMFSDVGRTALEGKQFLADQYLQEFFMHYKFKSNLVATDNEIEDYFNENPEFVDGWFDLQVAEVSYSNSSRNEVKALIENYIAHPDTSEFQPDWSAPVHILEDEVSSDKAFIVDLEVGKIVAKEIDGMFELYKLAAKEETKIRSLSERRAAIIEKINRVKLASMLEEYNKSVGEFIDIIPLNAQIHVPGSSI